MFTHPIGCAHSLVIDAVALVGQERGVPVAAVGPVVADAEGLRRLYPGCRELGCEIVLGVQQGGVLEVNWHGVAAQNLRGAPGSSGTLFFYHHLVYAVERAQ